MTFEVTNIEPKQKSVILITMPFLYKTITIFVIGLISCSSADAQHTILIDFQPSKVKVQNCLYNNITLLDARATTKNLGLVETGVFNRDACVATKTPLGIQFQNILAYSADQNAKSGELLFRLERITYAERHTTWRETGFFILQAAIYAKRNNTFLLLDKIDTVAAISSTIDVTHPVFKLSNKIISDFIVRNLTKEPEISEPHSYAELFQNQDKMVFSNYDIDSVPRPKAHSAVSTTETVAYTGTFLILMLIASHMKK
ncbi:hypothetical protein [Mucilaginibacter panaciglaebae]|uniref:Uncharacterized protein n=1 Tax=Mucilaginibacter panaciglaebae TaxID=502331 RepID=A0ABP7WLP3_9SPHI